MVFRIGCDFMNEEKKEKILIYSIIVIVCLIVIFAIIMIWKPMVSKSNNFNKYNDELNYKDTMIEYYKNNGDIQALDDEPKTRKAKNETPKKAKKETENNNGYTHLRLNLGGIDGLGPDSLIKLVYQQVGGGIRMRHIEVKKLYSTFDVLNAEAERVISGFRVLHVGNRKVSVEAITGNPKRKSRRAEHPKGKGRKKKY